MSLTACDALIALLEEHGGTACPGPTYSDTRWTLEFTVATADAVVSCGAWQFGGGLLGAESAAYTAALNRFGSRVSVRCVGYPDLDLLAARAGVNHEQRAAIHNSGFPGLGWLARIRADDS